MSGRERGRVRRVGLDEANAAVAVLSKRDDDVAPFVTTAHGGSFRLIGWESLDEELQDKFLTHVLPPAVAAQDVEMVGLVITTYLTPMTTQRKLREDERYEALLVATLGATGEERTLQARIDRPQDGPPTLREFEVLADSLPPAFAEPLHEGLFGRLEW
jgi:hypothetical protein